MKTRRWSFLALLPIFLAVISVSTCKRAARAPLYRFIDHLAKENIEASPLLALAADPEAFRINHPVLYDFAKRSPLIDRGSGVNPYLLKKKIKVGNIETNGLFAPPETKFSFTVWVQSGARLEFQNAIRRDDAVSKPDSQPRTVSFSALLEHKGRTETLFKEDLTLLPNQSLVFHSKRINLASYAGKKCTIRFVTQGQADALAFWFNPALLVPQEETRPVILISLDTLRPDHLGCYGYARPTSPAMDLLARDATLFENTYASSPWTLPSHVSMLTALNCVNHQVYQGNQRMDRAIPTLADFLREKGYTCAAITGGGFVSGLYGFSKGFDSYHVRGKVLSEDAAEVIGRDAIRWIKAHRDRDFFLFLHTYQIHNPYATPEPYNQAFLAPGAKLKRVNLGRQNHELRYKPEDEETRRNVVDLYDAEVLYTDAVLIQPLVAALKEMGLYDRALIVLTSDHGEEFYEHGAWLHTHSVYDESIRIPLIIKFAGSRHAAQRVVSIARITDIMPTILDELDVDVQKTYSDGSSLLEFLENDAGNLPPDKERVFLAELAANAMRNHIPKKVAVNSGRMKLILNNAFSAEELAHFPDPPPHQERQEVFDLSADPAERKNLTRAQPEWTRRLLQQLKKYDQQKRKAAGQVTEVSKDIREQLKALGYVR